MRNKEKKMLLELSATEAIALDRLLQIIADGKKAGKIAVRIPLNNTYFIEQLEKIASKKYSEKEDALVKEA